MKIIPLAITAMAMLPLLLGCNAKSTTTQSSAVPQKTPAPTPIPKAVLVYDGPFGLKMGMTIEELEKIGAVKTEDESIYSVSKVPVPNPSFDGYGVKATKETGLCKILAFTPSTNTNSFGDGIKSVHEDLKESLTKKYGKPEKEFNFVKTGSIWREREDFMMGLLKGDRYLSAYWESSDSTTQSKTSVILPNNIQSISLKGVATSSDKGYIALNYEFKNFHTCSSITKAAKDKSL